MKLATLCYASEAAQPDHYVRQDLMDIIDEAVTFNAKHEIFGVLYYGKGYFFQCLEGDQEEIEALYHQRIIKDRRHKHPQLLYVGQIEHMNFSSWNMKFAPYQKQLEKFFEQYPEHQHHVGFNPYLLTADKLPAFLKLLYDL